MQREAEGEAEEKKETTTTHPSIRMVGETGRDKPLRMAYIRYIDNIPRRDIDFKAPSRIIRTGSRIILLPS